jgi:hypothetical protein
VAELQALVALTELERKRQPAPQRSRWVLAAAFFATLLLASALIFVRTSGAPVEIEASVTEFQFDLPATQTLTPTLVVHSLKLAGARNVEPPLGQQALVLRAGGSECDGSVTLEPIVLPAGARVGIRASASARRVQLSLLAPGAVLRAAVAGCVAANVGASNGKVISGVIALTLGDDEADVELAAPDGSAITFAQSIEARTLAFTQIEQLAREDATHLRHISTLRAGRVVLPSLAGREVALRRGEIISFDRSIGKIQDIEPGAGTLALRFAGDVQGMATGQAEHRRSLMPTWLEWLRANQALSLLWGSALYLFGLVVGLLRWWRP